MSRRTDWTVFPRFAWTLFAGAAGLGLAASVLAVVDRNVLALAWLGMTVLWTAFAVVTFRGRRRTGPKPRDANLQDRVVGRG